MTRIVCSNSFIVGLRSSWSQVRATASLGQTRARGGAALASEVSTSGIPTSDVLRTPAPSRTQIALALDDCRRLAGPLPSFLC